MKDYWDNELSDAFTQINEIICIAKVLQSQIVALSTVASVSTIKVAGFSAVIFLQTSPITR